jgi:hypothetical protein
LAIPAEKLRNPPREPFILLLVWVLAGVAILPVIFKWGARPSTDLASFLITCLAYLIAGAIAYCIYRSERWRLTPRQAKVLAFLVFLLTCMVNSVHWANVDHGSNYFPKISNLQWQESVQNNVIQLSPSVVPHSYRFLPNAMVRWMEMAGAGFETGRDAYRLIFGMLLFWAIYRYARLYTGYLGSILALLLVAVIFPVSFENYTGQLTDPASHLSFVLSFIFLETGQFWFLLTAILLGSLAKETVLVMAGYYVLFHRKERHYLGKATLLCGGSALFFFTARFAVLKGDIHYAQISGVTASHIATNFSLAHIWLPLFLLTVGGLLPFLKLGEKDTPRALKLQVMFLFPVLFVSSLVFSWLHEARNWMPLVFVLAVITGSYLVKESSVVKEPAETDVKAIAVKQ